MPPDRSEEILKLVRDLAQEQDSQTRNLARLVRALEQDDHLTERAERAAEEERDERHKALVRLIKELPDRLLIHIERKIYELRIERHKAREAGYLNEAAPLPPPPTPREPTGKVLAIPDTDSIALTPAQQRGLWGLTLKAWRYKWHGVGGAVGLHYLIEQGAKVVEWLRHLGH
jgi:hypothetical protein